MWFATKPSSLTAQFHKVDKPPDPDGFLTFLDSDGKAVYLRGGHMQPNRRRWKPFWPILKVVATATM